LDVATGTGDVALAIAKAQPTARIVGLDPSREMLAVAASKVLASGFEQRIELVIGDALALPFENTRFFATSIAFGIRNLRDRAKGLAELARVTRPGGRVVVLELSEPTRGLLGALARLHVHHVVPRLGAWLSGADEYRYLARSIAAFPPPRAFASLMADAGIEVLRVTRLGMGSAHLYTGVRS
jgi:demethylmenaquinone methyltransferase/2-methoxy-6-polyprenyl-1,4-benzoquinol methylase